MDNKSYRIGWLRGFVDGEGYFSVPRREIVISNTNILLLKRCKIILDDIGIYGTISKPYRQSMPNSKLIYRLRIQRQLDVAKYIKMVGFTDMAKQEKAKRALHRYLEAEQGKFPNLVAYYEQSSFI